jgi:peptidoglycan/LPS O-acetylase OafA/YrhL
MHSSPPSRAPGVDLLRALAILSVMLYHLSSHGIALPAWVEHGWMGVDLFFVLSGYLIGWQLLRRYASGHPPGWRRFMLGRALRILPAYYAVLALYVLLPATREGGNLQPLWKYLTFTLNIFPDWGQGRAYSHAWSLCIEEHFYLVFPLLAWLLAKHASARQTGLLMVALLAGGAVLRGWLWHMQIAPHLASGDVAQVMDAYVVYLYAPSYARLDGLLMGASLAAIRAFRPLWWHRLQACSGRLMLLGCALLLLATHITPASLTGATLLFPLVALGCTALLAGMTSPAHWPGRTALPGAHALALLAFSLYLSHKQIYHWLDLLLPALGEQAPLLAMLLYCAASLAGATVLYGLIERPALRLRQHYLR